MPCSTARAPRRGLEKALTGKVEKGRSEASVGNPSGSSQVKEKHHGSQLKDSEKEENPQMAKVATKAGRPMCLGTQKDRRFLCTIAIRAGCLATPQADAQVSGPPMAHYGTCAKCGVYGHEAKLCPKQVNINSVQTENNISPTNPAFSSPENNTSENAFLDVGGGSFYFGIDVIDCVATETSNMFTGLTVTEDEEGGSWEDWREYYRATPAPKIDIWMVLFEQRNLDEQAAEAFNRDERTGQVSSTSLKCLQKEIAFQLLMNGDPACGTEDESSRKSDTPLLTAQGNAPPW